MLWYDARDRQYEEVTLDRTTPAGELPPEYVELLKSGITGYVALPGDSKYDEARRTPNPAFDNYPVVIVFCEVESDVALCLRVARETGVPAVARSGGHSTGGFSTQTNAIVIDVSRINDVCIASDRGSVWVGAGTKFRKLNERLELRNLHLTGGACGDVCVGGYMQGGGYGFTARIFGLNCDHVLEVEVMLTDGSIVHANAEVNSDLFWAVRGGTGSNFGVLLRIRYAVHEDANFAGFSIRWDLSKPDGPENAAHALAWLQENFMMDGAADGIGYQMIWVWEGPYDGERTPYLLMRGMYRPTDDKVELPIAPVLELPGAELQKLYPPMTYMALNKTLLTDPYPVPQFDRPDSPLIPEGKLSRIISRRLSQEDWLSLVRHFLKSPNPYTTIAMEVYGGAIEQVGEDDTAFIHRKAYCDLFCDVFWKRPEDREEMEAYLAGWEAAVEPFWDGFVYQNYPKPGDVLFAPHYWGDRVPWLAAVRRKYDPDNVLRYPQSLGILTAETGPPALGGLSDEIVTAQLT